MIGFDRLSIMCYGATHSHVIICHKMATVSAQGGYECQFVVDPPNELQSECPICLHVIREPYLVDCCGYRFCKTCIKNIRDSHKPCPLCNTKFSTTVPDKFLQRTLLDRKVKCRNKEEGCRWTGELRYLEEHLNEAFSPDRRLDGCRFVTIKCTHCVKFHYRFYIEEHESDCPKRPFLCKHCKNHSGSIDDLISQHWPQCPDFPVECSKGCGEIFRRADIEDHINKDCPLTVLKCEFEKMGCRHSFCRKHFKEHMETKALRHVSLLAEHIKTLDVCIDEGVRECLQLIDEHKEKRKQMAEKDNQITRLEKQVQELSLSLDKGVRDSLRLMGELKEKKKKIAEKDDRITRLEKRVQELSLSLKPSLSHFLLVTNCPPATNEQKLKSIFGPFGQVSHVVYNSESNFALVYFQKLESAQLALTTYQRVGFRLHKTSLNVHQM